LGNYWFGSPLTCRKIFKVQCFLSVQQLPTLYLSLYFSIKVIQTAIEPAPFFLLLPQWQFWDYRGKMR
jgi:hypothetical protein